MKKILPILVVGILVLSGYGIGATHNHKPRENKPIDNVEIRLQNNYLDFCLSLVGLSTEDTITEFKQLLYNKVSKKPTRNPRFATGLKNDIDKLSEILQQIGVTDDMTIKKSMQIIENNKELLQQSGINLFCYIGANVRYAYFWPWFRLFKVVYGHWYIQHGEKGRFVIIYNPTIGLQYCKDYDTAEHSGDYICLIGLVPPVIIGHPPPVISRDMHIKGFALFSICTIPFTVPSNNYQQSSNMFFKCWFERLPFLQRLLGWIA
ncbi:MAG: hypothetical protein JSW60_08785 [Thermoplasmatales archaeon]|nr:MAG: hypothetical protein JSW60_08785 [Thermoplasmatales archaeon]